MNFECIYTYETRTIRQNTVILRVRVDFLEFYHLHFKTEEMSRIMGRKVKNIVVQHEVVYLIDEKEIGWRGL